LNTQLIIGIVLVLLGILVLVSPQFLSVIVGLTLIIGGLYLALQNAPRGGGSI
jgi:multisubunit Na+/H+ antiporter MnhC subunit